MLQCHVTSDGAIVSAGIYLSINSRLLRRQMDRRRSFRIMIGNHSKKTLRKTKKDKDACAGMTSHVAEDSKPYPRDVLPNERYERICFFLHE